MPPTPPTGETFPEPVTPEAAFGIRMRRARERQGISLREMARRLTRSHSNLWDYERGHRLATVDIAGDYERELGLAAGELLEPLETARREVYGEDRDRRRPFRAPPPAPVGVGARWETRPKGPFAGRDAEMAAARTWLEEAGGGEPRIILVHGDAGIGKSTLLVHLLAGASDAGWLPLRGFCLQGARIAYLPLASALTPLRAGNQLAGAAPAALSELFARGADGELESDAAADRRHLNLVVTAARAVLDAAEERPLVLAIEDLHWADDSTLGFLELLAAVATQKSCLTPVPLALILTARSTHESDAARRMMQRVRRETTCRELQLTGLDSLEINQVVRELADATPSRRLLHSITEASAGNPLLVRSLVERLLSNGAIAVRGDRLGGDAPFPAVALDLDGELADRLGRVSADAADFLSWAAVLGDGNSTTALQAVTQCDDDEFDQLMALATDAKLLYDEGENYRFDHPELREVLYARMPNRQRRRRHLAVAERLEERFGSDTREVGAQIAHHLNLAGPEAPVAKLAGTARRAAEQSFALAAWSDAAAYYDIYLATDQSAGNDPGVLWRAGLAHYRNHDYQEAESRLLRAVERAKAGGDERSWGRAALTLTKSRVTGGSWLGAEIDVAPLQDFLQHSHRDVDDLRARAYSLLSDADFSRFDFGRGFEEARRALEAAGDVHDDEVAAEVELALSIQHLAALRLDEAEEHLLSCQQSAARLTDPWASSWAASRLPLVRWCRGELLAAEAHAASAADLATDHFDWAEVSLATACRVNVAVAQGRLADAERLGRLATQQYLRSDYQWTVLVLAPALIAARAFRGQAAPALEAIEMVGRAGVDTGPFRLAVEAILGEVDAPQGRTPAPPGSDPPPFYNLFDLALAAVQVEVCDRSGDPDGARAALGPLEAANRAGFEYGLGWVASVPRLLGVVYRCLGCYDEAETWLADAVARATRAAAPAELARARLNQAQLLMAQGEERAAITAIDESARSFKQLGLSALAARSDQLRMIAAQPRS